MSVEEWEGFLVEKFGLGEKAWEESVEEWERFSGETSWLEEKTLGELSEDEEEGLTGVSSSF